MALCSSPVSHILRSFDENDDLARANYTNWSVCMKTYLLSQDLWDVIDEASSEPKEEDSKTDFKTLRKKNAAALLAIQNSCEPDILSKIMEITSAKVAWDTLAKTYKPEPPTVNSGLLVPKLQAPTISQGDSSLSTINPGDRPQLAADNQGDPSLSTINPSNRPQLAADNQGIQDNDCSRFKTLLGAIKNGDLDLVKSILTIKPEAINARITGFNGTLLHVATNVGHVKIVENLVELMSEENLEIKDDDGYTALAIASSYRIIKIAECMIRKNKNLLTITDNFQRIALATACSCGHKDMIHYLYSVTPLEFLLHHENGNHASHVLSYLIDLKMFDIALDLLRRCPRLTITRSASGLTPLQSLSLSASAFPSGCRLVFWKRWIYSCICVQLPIASDIRVNIPHNIQNDHGENNRRQAVCQFRKLVSNLVELFGIKQIYDLKLMHKQALEVLRYMSEEVSTLDSKALHESGVRFELFNAAERGIVEFTIGMIKANSNLMVTVNNKRRSIFHKAIEHRQEKIFSLLYGLGARNARVISFADDSQNNMLHVAGMKAPCSQLNRISGAALQMQRELQWYKEVDSIINPAHREYMNHDDELPRQVFTKNHKELVKEGEKWMKGTATSYTVVGALIITIMFAAAFTVPGGNDQNTGFPIFLHRKMFTVFIISDAISLFSSATSVLMFLGILTSRYAEDDFLKSLPTKLIVGLSTLFFSIATMMVAFSAALLLMLKGQLQIVIPIVSLAGVPITLFVMLQFPLLVEIFMSTYGLSIFDTKMKPWL